MMNGIDAALLMLCPSALGLIVQERASRISSGTAPRVSTFCLTDVTTSDQISQAFPIRTLSNQVLEVGKV